MKASQANIKSSKSIDKRIGKRTYTLKELAQRDFAITPTEESTKSKASIFSLVNIQEDLLEIDTDQRAASPDAETQIPEASSTPISDHSKILSLSIDLVNQLIAKEIEKTARAIELEEVELQAWIDLQVMTPRQTLLALLRIARENHLDPLKEEVALALYDDIHWHAYITVEGYSKILNNHPAFDGIAFTQSDEIANGIPLWMECTIYRKDRSHPIVVREYFDEVKGEQAIWQKMPRRMLRHRVMQQCTRMALG
jgi:hypothetical protein